MHLQDEELLGLAALARVRLSAHELEQRRGELERILGYVNRLAKIDTSDVPEAEAADAIDVLREDIPCVPDPGVRQRILDNFPDHLGDALRVPGVFEKPKG